MSAADAKAAEAAQSAYYDPNKPQCAYVPPPAYYVSIEICEEQTTPSNIILLCILFDKMQQSVVNYGCFYLGVFEYFKLFTVDLFFLRFV